MPKFTVTAPDGKEYEVNAPEGATHEDAVNHVKQTYYSSAPNAELRQPSKPSIKDKNAALADKLLNSPIGGFLRGMRDPIDAGAQMLTRGLESVAPAGSDFEKYMQQQRQNIEGINQQAEQDYKQNWRQGEDTGLDVGRIAGNIAGTLPVAAAVPGAAATTTLGRVGYGAGLGAVSGALQPVDTSQGQDFGEKKAEQVGIGAAFGAVSPFIADAIGKAVGSMSRRMKSAFTPQQAQELNQKITGEFQARGVDFNRISEETRKSILDDVASALKAGKDLDYDAIAMKANFEKVGIQPTLGQLTRDPMQYQFEQNTRGLQGSGEQLAQRFSEQNQGLINALSNFKPMTGGQSIDLQSTGDDLINALKNVDAARKSGVDTLYQKARESAGINTPLNPGRFTQSLNDKLDQAMIGDALPAGVRKAINQIATGEMPFTIQKAEQLRQAINGQITNIPNRDNLALKMVNQSLDDELANIADDLGGAAKQTFQQARAAASERFSINDATPAIRAAITDAAPDDFINKYVLSSTAKARDLYSLRSQLQSNPEAWNNVRASVADWLKIQATGGKADEFAKFSQSAYDRAIKKIGDAKMKILFSPDEINQIKTILKVGQAIQIPPVGAAINTSNTSQAVANLMHRVSGIPYMRELVTNPLHNYVVQTKVESALNPTIKPTASAATLDPELIRRLMMPIALSGAPMMQQR